MYILKRSGPKLDPSGIPDFIGNKIDEYQL